MKTYKIIYNSKIVKNNFFFVDAENSKDARKKFKDEYIKTGGNFCNVLNIVSSKPTTKKYKVSFNGRLKNASGIFYKISEVLEMSTDATNEEIKMELYKKYDHITEFKIK